MKKLLSIIAVLMIVSLAVSAIVVGSRSIPKKKRGTTYTISNQTNVLVVWFNEKCGPGQPPGEIYPDKPLVITVEPGGSRKLSFAARYSAPKCGHCYERTLTGSETSTNEVINLTEKTFCY
ncbi:MAG: hypothetical protein EOO42_18310 [Flavobacteriales bacterium]|nr:MAG: hypothetical protein EOO42_18310 [Flavobacteriales bacterium]